MPEPEGLAAPESDPGFEMTLDRHWRIVSITKSAAAWAGSTVQDLIGRDGHEINPAATAMLAGPIEAALARGETSKFEHPSTHVPGRWVKIEVSPFEDGVRVGFEDVTSNVQSDVVHSAREGPVEIALLDGRGVIVSANAQWRASAVALGLELIDSGVGARYIDVAKTVYPLTDRLSFSQRMNELFSGRISELEATYDQATPQGKKRRQVRMTPLRIGETTYFLAIHEDLSERAKVLAALHETSDQLLHAQEQERQRIAIELHDSMSQHLAALQLGIAQLRKRLGDDPAGRELAHEMQKLTQQAFQEIRVLSYLMNASGREREGLETSVRRFVQGFGRRAGLKTTFDAEGPVDDIGAATQHAVFRVVQEALSNVYRHAHATAVSVDLLSKAGTLTVRVSDNGRGIPLGNGNGCDEPPFGVGIAGMRARIEQLGGTLEFTGKGRGTVVTAIVPAARSNRSAAPEG
jgi:signal transduction histidine kinase